MTPVLAELVKAPLGFADGTNKRLDYLTMTGFIDRPHSTFRRQMGKVNYVHLSQPRINNLNIFLPANPDTLGCNQWPTFGPSRVTGGRGTPSFCFSIHHHITHVSISPTMFRSMLRDLVDGPAKTVWIRVGLPPDDIENLWLSEAPDPSVNSSFKLGTAAQVCLHVPEVRLSVICFGEFRTTGGKIFHSLAIAR
jgi:hypothetical protein